MNSLMEAIYGNHKTEYIMEQEEYSVDQMLPEFMQSLINHLV